MTQLVLGKSQFLELGYCKHQRLADLVKSGGARFAVGRAAPEPRIVTENPIILTRALARH